MTVQQIFRWQLGKWSGPAVSSLWCRQGHIMKKVCRIIIGSVHLIPEAGNLAGFDIACSQSGFADTWSPWNPGYWIFTIFVDEIKKSFSVEYGLEPGAWYFSDDASTLYHSAAFEKEWGAFYLSFTGDYWQSVTISPRKLNQIRNCSYGATPHGIQLKPILPSNMWNVKIYQEI